MNRSGRIEDVAVVGIEFVDNGRSLRFEIVETIPPHGTSYVTFKNACGVKLFQWGGEEFPLTIIDLIWQEIPIHEKGHVLAVHDFPFLDGLGKPIVSQAPLVIAHLEGDIVGDIISEELIIDPA